MISVSGGLDAWHGLASLNHTAAFLFPGWLDSFSPQPCTKQATSERETSPVKSMVSHICVLLILFFFLCFCSLPHQCILWSFNCIPCTLDKNKWCFLHHLHRNGFTYYIVSLVEALEWAHTHAVIWLHILMLHVFILKQSAHLSLRPTLLSTPLFCALYKNNSGRLI